MNEKKIVLILAGVIAVIYIGIEPLAHAVMHPLPKVDYSYGDLADMPIEGNAKEGQKLVRSHCTMCHSVSIDLGASPISKMALKREFGDLYDENSQASYDKYCALSQARHFGVVPLDLSNVGRMYDPKFLANFIKRPAHASFESTYVKYKKALFQEELSEFKEQSDEALQFTADYEKSMRNYLLEAKISMPDFTKLSDARIGDIVAYLDLISRDLSPKEATELACGRCHSVDLAGIAMTTEKEALHEHFGSTPPDLSMIYKSRGEAHLHAFLNDPQAIILGSKMPRIGLNKASQQKIITYLESVADPKKEERESLAWLIIGYFLLFAVVTYLWYKNEYERIHE